MPDLPDSDRPFSGHRLAPPAMHRERMLERARAAWVLPPARSHTGWKPWVLAAAASLLVLADVVSTAWCRGGGRDERVAYPLAVVEAGAVPHRDPTNASDGIDDRRTYRLARLFPADPDYGTRDLTVAKLQYRNIRQELP